LRHIEKTKTLMRDPIWQFVGAIIGVIAVVATYNIFNLQREDKNLTISILAASSLIALDTEVAKDIEIKYKGYPISNLALLYLEIYNSGNVPVLTNDFEDDIVINLGVNAKKLDISVFFANPPNLIPDFYWETDNKLRIKGQLFNPEDRVIYKLIMTNQ
jgi:hypothetical protein